MDIESFAFAVRTTIVGMIIVFLFLGMLSLLMVVIRYLFDPQGRRSTGIAAHPAEPEPEPEPEPDSGAADEKDNALPRAVVIAAVGAYLEDCAQREETLAHPWAANINAAPWKENI